MTQTHFGYETVDENEKAGRVRGVFDSVAKKYDVMNDLMSVGMHRAWKKYTVAVANLKAGDKALDIAGGTGEARDLRGDVGHLARAVGQVREFGRRHRLRREHAHVLRQVGGQRMQAPHQMAVLGVLQGLDVGKVDRGEDAAR